jgi:hypothetical protein
MSTATLNRICQNHGVPSRDRVAMARFVLCKVQPRRASTLRRLLGYSAAMQALIRALSDEYFQSRGIRFPPVGWKIGDPRPKAA